MKKIIIILLAISTLLLCFTSCACKTCAGDHDILCKTCNGKGKEICSYCDGNGDCDDCIRGMVRDDPCSNKNCNYGYVTTSFGKLECGECDGTGLEERECHWCDGSGQCCICDGTGLKKDAKTCQDCSGTGRMDCPDCE